MVTDDLAVRTVTGLPDGIDGLLATSLDEGHNLVKRLIDDWRDGSNRFDVPGETLMEGRAGPRLVGVGGLNLDPYLDDPTAARIRHLYVEPRWRRRGVGAMIVFALIDHARMSFSRVRLRTTRPDAARFYVSLGFEQATDEPDATHVFWL